MEVHMLFNPALSAFVFSQYQAEAEARAYSYRVGRQARGAARLAKTKIPSRLPRYWRWRYLGTRVSFRRRYAGGAE
jgi:hypothetical protein